MGLDLDYLLFLQMLRNALGGGLDELFNALSKFAVDVMPIVPFLMYWAVDKVLGYRFLITHFVGDFLNGLIKLTVCAYRPWIRSDAIVPAGDSKTAATGYSFPSGHTFAAGSVYGNTALWQWKRHRGIAVLCIILILVTGFSRNYLGVHTPQDVIVGMALAMVMIAVVTRLEPKLSGNETLLDRLSVAGVIFTVLALVYVINKSYPMDYIDGKLIVDPKSMQNDFFRASGYLLGLIVSSWIDRHYMHYEIPLRDSRLPLLAGVSFAVLFGWRKLFGPATVVVWLGKHWGNLIHGFLYMILGMVLLPLWIRKMTSEKEPESFYEPVKQAEKTK